MATAGLSGVLWHVRQMAEGPARSDDELLARFRTDRDESAFAALVHRHGPMVFGVCRRTLRNDADAEDAFQATFLVLARRAHEVRPAGQVGHWLYGVAFNTARKARVMNRRRVLRERLAGAERLPQPALETSGCREALDIELRRLPDHYRAPIVLCDLEGESLKHAARQLDCPAGTVASRLARGRDLLRRSLARRGIALSALLTPGVALARVPARLGILTTEIATGSVPAAATVNAIAQGVMQAMFLSKMKFVLAAVVAAGVLVAGIGNGIALVSADGEKPAQRSANSDKPVKPDKPAGDSVKKPGFAGIVKAVDPGKMSLTLAATKGEAGVERSFTVANDAPIKIDGHEGKLSDLKIGYHASVVIGDDKTTVVAVGCAGPNLVGELKEISAEKKMLKVAVTSTVDKVTKETKVDEKSVQIAEDVKLVVDGNKLATLADLKVGTTVMVQIAADGERALVIMSPAKSGGDASLVGELKAIAADKKSITVAVTVKVDKSTVKTEEKSIKLAEDVKIAVDGKKPATLADLKVGSMVALYLSKDGSAALAIRSKSGGDGDKKPEKPVKPVKPNSEKSDKAKPGKGAGDK